MNSQSSAAPTLTNANYGYGNHDPNNIQTDEVINAVFVVDVSGSISGYVNELNKAYNEFKNEMQSNHVGPKLFVSTAEFNDKVVRRTGFQPIISMPDVDFSQHIGGMTALYDATLDGLKNALNYRDSLEVNGINVKTLLFIITDGGDNNSSSSSASDVKALIEGMRKEERSFGSFTSILFGIGPDRAMFEHAKDQMGIEFVGVISNTGKDIRKMISWISSSISSASAGNAQSAPNF